MNPFDFDTTRGPEIRNGAGTGRRPRPLVLLLALVTVMVVLAAACSSTTDGDQAEPTGNNDSTSEDGSNSEDLDSGDIILTSGLETVARCDDLLERLRAEGSERVGPYGFGDGWYGIPMAEDTALEAEEMADDEAQSSADAATTDVARDAAPAAELGANGGDGEFSGTNVQEQRVDEADLVKTDGRRLVTVAENQMQVIDVTADPPRLERTIKLPEEFWGGELFLYQDTALLMTSGWTEQPFVSSAGTADLSWFPGSPTGRLMEVDLNRGEIVRTFEFEGSYLSAREIDDTIRIALTASASRFEFLFPSNPGAEEQAEEFNRQLIENSTIEQWIPTYRVIDGAASGGLVDDVIEEGLIVECDRVHLPEEFAGFGSLVVLTADLSDGLRLKDSLSVFTDATTVYASTDRMAVATPRWPTIDPASGLPEPDESYRTAIHSFDITDPDRTEYVASGSVDGHLLNRYSLSEYDGYLRVATTDGSPWAFEEGMPQSESFVTVLDEENGELVEVGKVGGLGRGEQIFAVRFLGDRGYVVTFRQIDPLYTLDLSDPTNPKVEGELKIPGFSNYLHPLDDGLLMGVGMDGDESGFVQGAVVSLFDVSNPADPVQLDKLPLVEMPAGRDDHSYSPVNNDPRAFTYWNETAIVPVSWWMFSPEAEQQERNGSEAVMIQIDDRELIEVGRVAHPYLQECEGLDGPVRRYVELDDEGNIVGQVDASPDSSANPERETTTTTEGSGDAEAGFVDGEEPNDDDPVVEAPIRPKEDYCWIHSPEIMRTVVVGDTLYTVSFNGVGVHNFESGSTITWIPFDRL